MCGAFSLTYSKSVWILERELFEVGNHRRIGVSIRMHRRSSNTSSASCCSSSAKIALVLLSISDLELCAGDDLPTDGGDRWATLFRVGPDRFACAVGATQPDQQNWRTAVVPSSKSNGYINKYYLTTTTTITNEAQTPKTKTHRPIMFEYLETRIGGRVAWRRDAVRARARVVQFDVRVIYYITNAYIVDGMKLI